MSPFSIAKNFDKKLCWGTTRHYIRKKGRDLRMHLRKMRSSVVHCARTRQICAHLQICAQFGAHDCKGGVQDVLGPNSCNMNTSLRLYCRNASVLPSQWPGQNVQPKFIAAAMPKFSGQNVQPIASLHTKAQRRCTDGWSEALYCPDRDTVTKLYNTFKNERNTYSAGLHANMSQQD